MIFIITTLLLLIYIQFGLFTLIQILILLIVFFLSNLLLIINPISRELHIIRIMALTSLILILYYNYNQNPIIIASILPLSISKISYLDDINTDLIVDNSDLNIEKLYLINSEEISKFLNKLNIGINYGATIEFIPEIGIDKIDMPHMLLAIPFAINRFSSQTTLSKFINERLNLMVYFYKIDDKIIGSSKEYVVIINYFKIYL